MRTVAITSIVLLALPLSWLNHADEPGIRILRPTADPHQAELRVHTDTRSSYRIPRFITGKFAEHLGFNIYNGMDAQILRNPTFAEYPVRNGQMNPDGVAEFLTEGPQLNLEFRRLAARFGWPESELDRLAQARAEGLAAFWTREGQKDAVQVSPDTGPNAGRAQRVKVLAGGQGVGQWTWLPLHRTHEFDVDVLARSRELRALVVSVWAQEREQQVASVRLDGVSSEWRTLHGKLLMPVDLPSGAAYRLTVTADGAGEFVLAHAFLRPTDAINGADPDIIRFLQDAHLPLLRWPGGNFVSSYHWQDGVGPIELRPTSPNLAWGGVELNTFGTDEFIAFCRTVGCEPMICVNAGSGTPEEAARWIEYCNGSVTSPMGALRATNGHPEPFHVRHWEVGNELWGHWQMRWTTAPGYVDRYQRFARAMLSADSNIVLYACGAPAMSGRQWNDTLIGGLAPAMPHITDHPLIGGTVSPTNAPLNIYRDFMAVPEVLQGKWDELQSAMRTGGIGNPKLAVTELQLFAHLGRTSSSNDIVQLTPDRLPSQGTITEAIYDVLIYHAAVRLQPFVELITHSAVVNHGGGLRKERERVWANPCHYAQAGFTSFAGAVPVQVEIASAVESAPMVLPDLRHAAKSADYVLVDALAALAPDGALLLSVVPRGTDGPISCRVLLDDFPAASDAQVRILSADAPWIDNTLQEPDRIRPVDSTTPVSNGVLMVELRPYSVVRIRVPPR
jgi:alpha-N-arabinofuranosidase